MQREQKPRWSQHWAQKDSLRLENGGTQAKLTAMQVPILTGFFYKHKIEWKIQDWDKMAIIKGW